MKKTKRILALIGAALLVLLYLSTLFTAVFCTKATAGFFKASVYCTILVPLILYGYLLVSRVFRSKDKGEE